VPGEVQESSESMTVSEEAAVEMWSARRQRNLPPGSLCLHVLTNTLTRPSLFRFVNLPAHKGQKMLALVAWVTSKELALFKKFPEVHPSFIFIIFIFLFLTAVRYLLHV
jgi:hypothetical protein